MFSRIEAKLYRSLRYVNQRLRPFHALVGPNGSGKTTFLDVIGLLSDIARTRGDVRDVIRTRSSNFEDLVWMARGDGFQVAVEAPIPSAVSERMTESLRAQGYDSVRYEIELRLDPVTNEIGFDSETLWLKNSDDSAPERPPELFPFTAAVPKSILTSPGAGRKALFKKRLGGNDNYYPEGKDSYKPSFPLGRTRAALVNIPGDVDSFPVSTWFRSLLEDGVQNIVLNSQYIRQPSAPGLGRRFLTDGSNLPWVIAELRKDVARFRAWVEHVQTALPDVVDIDTTERAEDKHRYLNVRYRNGATVPSWLVSDGTLRLLSLTIPAYLPDMTGVFLIEEPENGIHPRALETVLQSLTSIYAGQVLIATHSPVAINQLESQQILCFAKDAEGATDVVSGDLHPSLRSWKHGEPDLGTLFASGILS